MDTLGFTAEEKHSIFSIISGTIQLGNITFSAALFKGHDGGTADGSTIDDVNAANAVAVQLGCVSKQRFSRSVPRDYCDVQSFPNMQWGSTMIFFRADEYKVLELCRALATDRTSSKIQAMARGRLTRRYVKLVQACRPRLRAACASRDAAQLKGGGAQACQCSTGGVCCIQHICSCCRVGQCEGSARGYSRGYQARTRDVLGLGARQQL
jgi:hypothetical protein